MSEWQIAAESLVAGLFASLACGLGALPVAFDKKGLQRRVGLGYAFASGLMFAASVYNLLMPAFTLDGDAATDLWPVVQTQAGVLPGCAVLWLARDG